MAQRAQQRPFRFYDNREKYLLFTTTCSEKQETARRIGREFDQPARHLERNLRVLHAQDLAGVAQALARLQRRDRQDSDRADDLWRFGNFFFTRSEQGEPGEGNGNQSQSGHRSS